MGQKVLLSRNQWGWIDKWWENHNLEDSEGPRGRKGQQWCDKRWRQHGCHSRSFSPSFWGPQNEHSTRPAHPLSKVVCSWGEWTQMMQNSHQYTLKNTSLGNICNFKSQDIWRFWKIPIITIFCVNYPFIVVLWPSALSTADLFKCLLDSKISAISWSDLQNSIIVF